ncbi:hypothetical protein BHE74_00033890 [Ensete ventricosum]|nr:hypothetical protein GW17_00028131 [Ensete ventricosum]RWW59192.1 hypothetical protein BHE74_00033890 [Ensete ventricosum]RZS11090.1 hypothetical protein BHM03_00042380 [Ensete ventricosum]
MKLLVEGLSKKSKMQEAKAVADQVKKKRFPENLVGGWKEVGEELRLIAESPSIEASGTDKITASRGTILANRPKVPLTLKTSVWLPSVVTVVSAKGGSRLETLSAPRFPIPTPKS